MRLVHQRLELLIATLTRRRRAPQPAVYSVNQFDRVRYIDTERSIFNADQSGP